MLLMIDRFEFSFVISTMDNILTRFLQRFEGNRGIPSLFNRLRNTICNTAKVLPAAAPQRAFGLRGMITPYLLLGFMPGVSVFTTAFLQAEEIAPQMNPATAVIEIKKTDKDESDFRFGLRGISTLETNAYALGSRDNETTTTLAVEPSVGVDVYNLKARLAASKLNKAEEKFEWAEDLQLSLSRKAFQLARDWKFTPSATLILPLTEQSKKYSLMSEGVSGGAAFDWSLDRYVKGLNMRGTLSASHYRFETPVAFNGISNEKWRLRTRFIASYEIVETLSVEMLFGKIWAWSVKGTGFDKFEMDESINWSPAEWGTLALGHSRSGSVSRSDGNSNLALFDTRDSTFYLSLELSI